MDAKQCVEILDQHIAQIREDLGIPLENAIFQKDNGPKDLQTSPNLVQGSWNPSISNSWYIFPNSTCDRLYFHNGTT